MGRSSSIFHPWAATGMQSVTGPAMTTFRGRRGRRILSRFVGQRGSRATTRRRRTDMTTMTGIATGTGTGDRNGDRDTAEDIRGEAGRWVESYDYHRCSTRDCTLALYSLCCRFVCCMSMSLQTSHCSRANGLNRYKSDWRGYRQCPSLPSRYEVIATLAAHVNCVFADRSGALV